MKKLLFLIVVFIFCFNPCSNTYAQQLPKDVPYVWDSFQGFNSKLSPFSLSKGQATICENIRINTTSNAIINVVNIGIKTYNLQKNKINFLDFDFIVL